MALFALANLAVGAFSAISTFVGAIGPIGACPLPTNLEEFDMEDYHDRH